MRSLRLSLQTRASSARIDQEHVAYKTMRRAGSASQRKGHGRAVRQGEPADLREQRLLPLLLDRRRFGPRIRRGQIRG